MWTILLTFLTGIVCGGCLVGTGLWYVLSFFFHDPDHKKRLEDVSREQTIPTSATFQLPPVLLSKISDESCKAKESCWAVNFILYFLFLELKNSESVRRWVLRKLALEFDELLATTVLGKFFSSVTIQNIDVGQNFPVVNWLKTSKVELHPVFKSISTLDILVDLDYAGGFQFSIQAESHLKHSAFLSVQFNEVKGQARLQFSTSPYAHWSFSFADNPEIDIGVMSQFYGKSFNQVTSIIAAQLKRSVKKKHTLPMYKIRYKPFFNRVQPIVAACVPNAAHRIETTGVLTITIVEIRGIMQCLLRSNLFATIGIANFDWVAAYESTPKHVYVVRDIGLVKTAKREAKLDFRLIQGEVPLVEATDRSPSLPVRGAIRHAINSVPFSLTDCELEPGDEIIAVDGKRVSTVKQCIRNFRNSMSVVVVWRIRRNYPTGDSEEYGAGESAEQEEPPENTTVGEDPVTGSENSSRRNSFTAESAEAAPIRTALSSRSEKIEQFYKSKTLPACRDPIFQDSFHFTLEESHKFVNIACWSSDQPNSSETSATSTPTSTPVKRPKIVSSHTLPFGRDSLLGTVSIPLVDVVTECATTGMGFFVKDFYMGPPDGKVAAEAKENELKNHSGFEPTMCYGKLTLSFQFKATEDPKRKTSTEESASMGSGIQLDFIGGEDGSTDPNQLSPGDEPQAHKLVRTHFKTSTVCGYCNKRIWFKEAYVCTSCELKCHKKCNERCLANTICRGGTTLQTKVGNPEIITTESEPQDEITNDPGTLEPEIEAASTNGNVSTVRRRTLGGLIASAVQGRSAQLKRVGSATTLLPPAFVANSIIIPGSKSLPPSPDASPGTSRKASVTVNPQNCGEEAKPHCINPFLVLDPSGSGELSSEELNLIIENLIHRRGEDLESLAKESGRDLYANQLIPDRKKKLNAMLTRLQAEIDAVSQERLNLTKDEITSAIAVHADERAQALTLLMLHYCAGLQHVHDSEIGNDEDVLFKPPTTTFSEPMQAYIPSSEMNSNVQEET